MKRDYAFVEEAGHRKCAVTVIKSELLERSV